jgi:hypothetical protein
MQAPSETPFFRLPKPGLATVITVTLDDGTVVQRDPKDLIALPPALNVPLASLLPGGGQ